ncbi:T9SS type A sorting domain-containing protein [Geofilum sp. OHC36d9]|uniref:T9SS type A sorting domain-containing protein n=1 Tax=Geofilum sp. OHC36d9 TaxID=3458413 RepID=UPI0040338AC5
MKDVNRGFRCVFLFLIVSVTNCLGQISTEQTPASFGLLKAGTESIIPALSFDSLSVPDLLKADEQAGITHRIGVVKDTAIDIIAAGSNFSVGDVDVWQYKVTCPDALSIGLFFSSFLIPEGASLFVYNEDHSKVLGAFTSENHKSNDVFSVGLLSGNHLIIEYNEDSGAPFHGQLYLENISLVYRAISQSDYVGINCDAGLDWQVEKQAVCLMTYNSGRYSYYCTGALMNNVREDNLPYFLSANHCISTDDEAQSLVVYFNYENSSCDADDASMDQSLSGASLRATSSYTDFTLLELSELPPDDYKPYYLGWDARSDSRYTSTTCIHHPEGMAKSIAIDHDAPEVYTSKILWDDNSFSAGSTHWEVTYDVGADGGGSSGSPLFNQDKRVIGQLHGGDDVTSYFGRFSLSWDYGSSSSERLKDWLDPDDTGTLALDGSDSKNPPNAAFSSDVDLACLETPVYFTDLSSGSPTSRLWTITPNTFRFEEGTDEFSANPVVSFLADADYDVTLLVANDYGEDTVVLNDAVKATADLPVNLEVDEDSFIICGSELNNYSFTAEGAVYYNYSTTAPDYVSLDASYNRVSLSLNDEGSNAGSFDFYLVVDGSHGRCVASDSVLLTLSQPVNDNYTNPVSLDIGWNGYFSNSCASVEESESYPSQWLSRSYSLISASPLENTVWFTFTGPETGMVSIVLEGINGRMAVYSDLYDLIGEESGIYLSSTQRIDNLTVEAGETYWLQIDGIDGAEGDFSISLYSDFTNVYPNPSTGLFHVLIGNAENGALTTSLYSMDGKRIVNSDYSVSAAANVLDLNLSGLPAGIYLLKMEIGGVVYVKKLVRK